MQQSISGQRRRSVLKRDFAIFTVSSVSVIDLWQCISRQLFRPSCFMVLLSQFLSRLRAENVRSKVAYVKGIVKFIFKRVFWEPKGVGRSSPNFLPLPPSPLLRRLCLWQINVKRRLIWLFFFYIKFCWRPATCFVARMLNVMFLYSRTIYILALLQTCLTYVFCCGTLLIYIGNHKI